MSAAWWVNRKSKIGLSPIAKEPPSKSPGRPWFTTPPTSLPQPEHIEYVAQFQAQVLAQRDSPQKQAMLKHLCEWMRAARHLFHVHSWDDRRPDMSTTDGILLAADDALREAIIACSHAGIRLDQRVIDTAHAMQAKLLPLRQRRAIESAKRDNGVTVRKLAHK